MKSKEQIEKATRATKLVVGIMGVIEKEYDDDIDVDMAMDALAYSTAMIIDEYMTQFPDKHTVPDMINDFSERIADMLEILQKVRQKGGEE